jgi:hypothetical protein
MSDPTAPHGDDEVVPAPDAPAPDAPASPAAAGEPPTPAPSEPAPPYPGAAPAPTDPAAPAGAPAYPAPGGPAPSGTPDAAGSYGAPVAPAAYGAATPPAYPGAVGQPAYGAPTAYAAPGQPLPGGPGPDTANRPKVLAIIALAVGILGLIMAFIPIVTWFSGIFLLAAFVMGLIALINKKQGGKGFAIAALAISVVGWIVSIIVTIASFAVIGQAAEDAISEGVDSEITTPETTEDEAPADDDAADAQDLEIVESAFGRDTFSSDTWWYVVVLDNPYEDYIFDLESIDIEAVDAAGTILDTSTEYLTLLSGETAITGTFFSVGQGEISTLDVRGPTADAAISSPFDDTGAFTIEGVAAVTDDFSTTVTGTVSGDFEDEQELVSVVVVARAADGTIIGGQRTFIERLPVDGVKVQFEAMFFDTLPADTTYDVYAYL